MLSPSLKPKNIDNSDAQSAWHQFTNQQPAQEKDESGAWNQFNKEILGIYFFNEENIENINYNIYVN